MDLGEFCPTRENAVLGVFVVNGGVFLIWLLMRRLVTSLVGHSALGVYFVLMPSGFLVWFNPGNLVLWLALALAIAGSVILVRAADRRPAALPERTL